MLIKLVIKLEKVNENSFLSTLSIDNRLKKLNIEIFQIFSEIRNFK
jgi:uncharacterized protein YkvS